VWTVAGQPRGRYGPTGRPRGGAAKNNGDIPHMTTKVDPTISQQTGANLKVITTFNQTESVSRHVRSIAPYDAVSSLNLIMERPQLTHFKLDWNESTLSPSAKVKDALMEYLKGSNGLNWYPPLFAPELSRKISFYAGVAPEGVLVTNGSDDSLELLMKTYLDPGDRIVTPYPTYAHALLFARSRGANIVKVVYPDVFTADLDSLLKAVGPRTKMIYLVNPNNPTGAYLHREEIEQVAARAPGSLIVVDEAYFEFCGETMAAMTRDHENIVVTRSFSKAFALAALRIGYILAHPNTITQLKRIYNPKSVNTLAQVAACAALDDLGYYDRYVKQVHLAKQMVVDYCAGVGLVCRNTRANYVLIQVPHVHKAIKGLENEGIYVRDRSGIPQLRGFFRFNLGDVNQTEEILRRMDKVFRRLGIVTTPA